MSAPEALFRQWRCDDAIAAWAAVDNDLMPMLLHDPPDNSRLESRDTISEGLFYLRHAFLTPPDSQRMPRRNVFSVSNHCVDFGAACERKFHRGF
jgi:hypothetical protein